MIVGTIGIGDGGGSKGDSCPKNSGKKNFRQISCKIHEFVNFSDKFHVEFGHFSSKYHEKFQNFVNFWVNIM